MLATESQIKDRLVKIYTTDEAEISNDKYRLLVLDACRFYGAAITLAANLPDNRTKARIARLSSKVWADDFLVKRHRVDRYWAHHATNDITHYNLPAVEPGDMNDFFYEMFYEVFREISQAE